MSLFEEIVNEMGLLNELSQATHNDAICNAVKKGYRMQFDYDDKKKTPKKTARKGKNRRFVLPFVYGELPNGKVALAGYETTGSTKRGLKRTPQTPKGNPWKLFLLDGISNFSITPKKYDETNITDAEAANNFNPNGDKRFAKIYAVSPLVAGYQGKIADPNQPIDDKPIEKSDIDGQIRTKVSFQPKQVQPVNTQTTSKTTKQPNTIDNTPENSYTGNSIEAPDARPITKTEIDGGETNTAATNNASLNAREDKPVTKDEIENPADNDATNLMKRMGLIPNENNEEEEEEAY